MNVDNADDEEENDYTASSPSPSKGQDGNCSLVHARVRMTSGPFEGREGTIIEVKRGWYVLDGVKGMRNRLLVRGRDLKVLRYGGGGDGTTKEEDEKGGEGEGRGDDEKVSLSLSKKDLHQMPLSLDPKDQMPLSLDQKEETQGGNNDDDDDDNTNLVGATVRIKSGKYKGLGGIVKEIQRFRHVQLDANLPIQQLVEISDIIKVLSYGENADSKSNDLVEKYMGAIVRVDATPISSSGDTKGRVVTEGKVLQIVAGEWYITDNPKISKAYQAEKFEVLKYAPARVVVAADKNHGEDEDAKGRKEEGKQQKQEETEKYEGGGEISDAINREDFGEAKVEVDEEPELNGKHNDGKAMSVSIAASSRDDPTGAPTTSSCDLIGGTIRVNKGKYKGLEGVIKEKLSLQRLQLDTVSKPLDICHVKVLRHPDDYGDDDAQQCSGLSNIFLHAKTYQKYVGAQVQVILPGEYEGLVGKVIRVIELEDWYITDNPAIATALTSRTFDVIKFSYDDDSDDDAADKDVSNHDNNNNNQMNDEGGDEIDDVDGWGMDETEFYPEDPSFEEEEQPSPTPTKVCSEVGSQPPSFLDAILNKRSISISASPNCDCCDPVTNNDEEKEDEIDDDIDDWGDMDGKMESNPEDWSIEEEQPSAQPPSLLDAILNKQSVSLRVSPDCDGCAPEVNEGESEDDIEDYTDNWGHTDEKVEPNPEDWPTEEEEE